MKYLKKFETWYEGDEPEVVITKLEDIPDFETEYENGNVTYRGLGMDKLSRDFYELAGEMGWLIKVKGTEYYITDTEFDTIRGSKLNFSAPFRREY